MVLPLPVQVVERGDDVLAGRYLVVGGDGVLEVEENDVGGALRGALEKLAVGPGDRQFAAVETRRTLFDDGETHKALRCDNVLLRTL